jgi:hypothetical protein
MRVTPREYLLLRKINVAAPGKELDHSTKDAQVGFFGRSLFRVCMRAPAYPHTGNDRTSHPTRIDLFTEEPLVIAVKNLESPPGYSINYETAVQP